MVVYNIRRMVALSQAPECRWTEYDTEVQPLDAPDLIPAGYSYPASAGIGHTFPVSGFVWIRD